MRKTFFKSILLICCTLGWIGASVQMIKTNAPKRPKGQTDVLRMACAPIPKVRVAFIGLGMHGPDAVERMRHINGVEIVALGEMCEEKTKAANQILEKAGLPKAQEFFGDENYR